MQIGPYVLSLRLAATVRLRSRRRDRSDHPLAGAGAHEQLEPVQPELRPQAPGGRRDRPESGPYAGGAGAARRPAGAALPSVFTGRRGLVILCDGDKFAVRAGARGIASRTTSSAAIPTPIISASAARWCGGLDEGVGLLSEDVNDDANVPKTATLMALNLRSFLCVPLIGLDQRRLGVIQLDCLRPGLYFRHDDLELLTAVSLHVASVLENAALHEEKLKEEKLRQELLVARNIQQSFLPAEFRPMEGAYELYASCRPAREMSGDLYDFFPTPDGKLALFIGDVTGKGMPSALMMVAVRTLVRHLATSNLSPGLMLQALNNSLCVNNPTTLFVTMSHAVFDPRTGRGGAGQWRTSPADPAQRQWTGRSGDLEIRHDGRLRHVRAAAAGASLYAEQGRPAGVVHGWHDGGVHADARHVRHGSAARSVRRQNGNAAVAGMRGRGVPAGRGIHPTVGSARRSDSVDVASLVTLPCAGGISPRRRKGLCVQEPAYTTRLGHGPITPTPSTCLPSCPTTPSPWC